MHVAAGQQSFPQKCALTWGFTNRGFGQGLAIGPEDVSLVAGLRRPRHVSRGTVMVGGRRVGWLVLSLTAPLSVTDTERSHVKLRQIRTARGVHLGG